MGKGSKAKDKKGKGEKSKKHPVHMHKIYEIKDGSVVRKNQFCPKCGAGVFMSSHKDRKTCGKCNYTEFNR